MELKQKIIEAIADMESKIKRDKKHVYTTKDTGLKLQGVSTVSSIVPKDWLAAWGAKEAVKALGYTDYENMELAASILEKIKKMDPERYVAFLKEAKGAHARKSKQALVDGKLGHQWIEDFIKAKINRTLLPDIPLDTPLERPLLQFVEWAENEVDYWIASEALVCRLDKGYAGQLDGIYMSKKGKLVLADAKFATHISEDYILQESGYCDCFEPYGIKFDERVIIRLPKTLETEVYENFTYKMVPNNIEIKFWETDYDMDVKAFGAALVVKKWINLVVKH